jgi:DNA repair exonuclease SbcCD nuclease subunit
LEFIYTTDWHLGKLRRFFPETHVAITINEIRKVCDYARKNGITNIVNGGDISDMPFMSQRYFKALIDLFQKYDDLTFDLMLGNHDFEDVETNSLQFLDICAQVGILKNIRIITVPTMRKIAGVVFNFLPFPYTKIKHKGPCLNFLHTDVKGAYRDNNRKVNKGLDIAKNGQFNIIGHIHKFQIINEWTMYPGALFQTTFGEALPKGFTHYSVKQKNGELKVEYKFIQSHADYELINLNVETRDDFNSVEQDSMKLYKLFLGEGLTVPKKLLIKRPNIVDIQSMRNGNYLTTFNKELPPDIYDGSNAVDDIVKADSLWGLREYLKRTGLDKEQVKRGFLIIETILSTLPTEGTLK